MSMTILVTGSTGTIGSELVKSLVARPGVTIRAAVRSAAATQAMRLSNIVPVDFDYDNMATMRAAVEGADAIFLHTPFVPHQVEFATRLVDAAKAARVKHHVKQSALGADQEPGIQLGRWHRG